jgi:hypothetical protein
VPSVQDGRGFRKFTTSTNLVENACGIHRTAVIVGVISAPTSGGCSRIQNRVPVSQMISSGSTASARAMQMRCFCPPDSSRDSRSGHLPSLSTAARFASASPMTPCCNGADDAQIGIAERAEDLLGHTAQCGTRKVHHFGGARSSLALRDRPSWSAGFGVPAMVESCIVAGLRVTSEGNA